MGVDVDSFVGIGITLNTKALKGATKTKNSCEHPERLGNKFCPVCGKTVTSHQVEDNQRWAEMDEYLSDLHNEGKLPEGLVYQRDFYQGNGDGFNFLGWAHVVGRENCPRQVPEGDIPDLDIAGKTALLDQIKDLLADYPEVYQDCVVRFYHGFIYS